MRYFFKFALSIANLGAHLALHFLSRLVNPRLTSVDQSERFLELYRADHIWALDGDWAKLRYNAMSCINCNLCDQVCESLRVVSLDEFDGPRAIASSALRDLPDIWTAAEFLPYCLRCARCEIVCPQGVPIADMVNLAMRKSVELRGQILAELRASKLKNISDYNNILGEREADFGSYFKEKAEYVVILGCLFRTRLAPIARQVLATLEARKLDFMLVDEVCCGEQLQSLGMDNQFCSIDMSINASLTRSDHKVIFLCPHCMKAWSRRIGERNIQLELHFINEFLPLDAAPDTAAFDTYHLHSCTLRRHFPLINPYSSNLSRLSSGQTSSVLLCCGGNLALEGSELYLGDRVGRQILDALKYNEQNEPITLNLECPVCYYTLCKVQIGSSIRLSYLGFHE